MKTLIYSERKAISPLAWCAKIDTKTSEINALVGSKVECRNNGLVAGVWDSSFNEFGFIDAVYCCCTGLYIYKGGVKFTTPTHMQEYLFAVKKDDVLFISNSMPFVLEESEEDLDSDYYDYEYDLNSTLLGYTKSKRSTPLISGNRLLLFRGCRITVNDDLDIFEERQNPNFNINCFSDYKSTVLGILSRLVDNGQDSRRKHQYGLVTTISRGYDACATSVFAKMVGCNSSLSFVKPNKYLKDDGRSIARELGFSRILTGDANLYKKNKEYKEAMAICTGDAGSQLSFLGFEKEMCGCLVFCGDRGDSVWERLHDNVNNDYDFSCGNTLAQANVDIETPLYGNFIHIRVPLICANYWGDIAKISQSEEMKFWSVRDYYDRPIARRLVEEEGVDRNEFGNAKMGAGVTVHYETLSSLKRKISRSSYNDIVAFKRGLKRNWWKNLVHKIKYFVSEYPDYVNYVFYKFHIKLSIKKKTGWKSSPIQQLLILWGTDKMIKYYRKQKSL